MEKLGIELPLLLTQIVNFTIMVIILTKILYQPILKSLAERRKRIADGLAYTEKAEKEKEKLVKKQQEILKDTRDEARMILENAKKDGNRLKEELLILGKQELSQLRVKQEQELDARLKELRRELQSHTVEIAAEMAKRVIGDIVTDEAQHKLIHKTLTRIEKAHEKS